MKKLFHFFIDGLGLGENTDSNPVKNCFKNSLGGNLLVKRDVPLFFPGGVLISADPLQGVPGTPQSATGQTSLFTGENAQAIIGMHLTAFPNNTLAEIIGRKSLLKVLNDNGISTTSANLYSQEFFDKRGNRRKNSFPVSTLSIKAAEIPFRFLPDYNEKKALFADITNTLIRSRGFDIPLITPEDGADIIANILKSHQAVFFEYFMTDVFGHKRDIKELEIQTSEISRFMERLLLLTEEMDDFLILVCSDHGNAEDNLLGDHTLNNVPVILFTKNIALQEKGAKQISRLTDVYDFVLEYFSCPKPE